MREIQQLDMFFLLPRRVSKVVRFVVGGHGASRCFFLMLWCVVIGIGRCGVATQNTRRNTKGNPRIS